VKLSDKTILEEPLLNLKLHSRGGAFGKKHSYDELPLRSELLSSEQMKQHGKALASTHKLTTQKPYNKGYEAYENELTDRFLHGELEQKDSINFPDSLKFKTKKGKIVYGGGGIMPEFFVPMDTLGYSNYFSVITNKGILYDFAFGYADKNRDQLKKFSSVAQAITYFDKQQVVNQLIAYATAKGVKPNQKEIKVSKALIQIHLYAYILRNIFDDKAFYQVLNKDDVTVKEAIKQLK
jgi:carboxyl-terminal processing protease